MTAAAAYWRAAQIDNLRFVISEGRIGLPSNEPLCLPNQKGVELWKTNPAEAKPAIARTLKPNMEGFWVG